MKLTESLKKHINTRKLKYGSFATALTALFIAAIVLVNIVATMLFDRFPITLDLTSGSIYTASEETIEYISGITAPVSITVLSTEDEYRSVSNYTAQCAELMKNYTRYNSGISLQFIDLLSNPDFVANYSQDLENGDIIVELDNGNHDRVKVVSMTDIIVVPEDYEQYLTYYSQMQGAAYAHSMFAAYNYIQSSNAEQALTSAIMAVTDANPIIVAVLSYPGANEANISGFTDLLDTNGYMITNVDIQAEELTDDIDLAIIPAPKVDYSTEVISKLEKWLEGGGMLEKDLIYIASSEQPQTPNLDGLLYKYGITVEPKIIHETSTSRYSSLDTYTFQDIVTEDHLDDVTNPDLPVFVADARPLTLRFQNVDSVQSCEPLIASAGSAVLKDMFVNDPDWTPETAEERGVFNTLAIGKQKKINQDTHISTYTYVLVFGSDLMVDPTVLTSPYYNNDSLFISVINDITGKTEGITITPKVVEAGHFDITEAQTRTLTLIFALIIPVAVLAVGTAVWLGRRHR